MLSAAGWPVMAKAQSFPDYPQSPYQFENISEKDGLSDDTVLSIYQTAEGFMWFGTENGLNQYNGYDFEIYVNDPKNNNSVGNNHINALLEDHGGGLWIGTNHGLDWISPENGEFSHYLTDEQTDYLNTISVLYEDRQNSIWVGTSDAGLYHLDLSTMAFTHYQTNRFNHHSINGNEVTAITEDKTGALWVGTTNGLNRYDSEKDRFVHFVPDDEDAVNYPIDPINAMMPGTGDGLWLGTNGSGLVYYLPKSGTIMRYRSDDTQSTLSSNVIMSLVLDSKNRIWIGSDKGLDTLDPVSGEITHLQNAPQHSYWVHNAAVRCIMEDQSGIIWISSAFGGVSKYDPNMERFTLLQSQKNNPQSLGSNDVTGITETGDGVLWISTYNNGITLYDRKTAQFSFLHHNPIDPTSLASDAIRTLMQSSDGHIWVGTVENGLDRYRPSTNIFTHFTYRASDDGSISENNITALFEDHAGRIWVGTYSQGFNLAQPDDFNFVRYQHEAENENSLLDDHVLKIYEDSQHNLWIGTWSGISVFNPETGQFRHYQNDINDKQSLSSNMVFTFYQSDPDTMWIGTNGGGVNLLDIKTGIFRQLNDPDNLLNITYAILASPDGTLWFSTNQGLVHYDPFREEYTNYDERDGLQGNEFNVGASYQNASGEIFLGGSNGLNIFQPLKIYKDTYVSPVAVLAIRSGNEVLYRNITSPITVELPHDNADVSFEFGMLDYSEVEKNEYAYQLLGYDEDWIYTRPGRRFSEQDNLKNLDQGWYYVSARRVATYTNLPDGRYTFRVKGSNDDQVWDSEGLSVNVIIKPPFWKTVWFPIGMLMLIVATVFFVNNVRSRRMRSLNRVLEKQVNERTYEIQQKQEVADGLRDILAYINSDQSLEEILAHLAKRSIRLMNADTCVVLQYEEEICICEDGDGPDSHLFKKLGTDNPLEYMQKLFCAGEDRQVGINYNLQKSIRQKMNNGSEEASLWYEWQMQYGRIYHGLVTFPIMVRGGKVAGNLLYFYQNTNPIHKKDAEIMELGVIFADQAALAIENALLRQTAETNAVTAERNRIARDLHDAVTQTLFSASLVAEVLPRIYDEDAQEGYGMLKDLQQMTRGALAEMRTLLIELRPTSFDEISLGELIRQLADSFVGKLDVPVNINVQGNAVLPPAVQTAIFRIAQEALNNIQKHGQARHVDVHLEYTHDMAQLCIQDDGCGFDYDSVQAGHMGLKIMRERSDAIGAKLSIQSKINYGTTINLLWKADENKVTNG